MKQRKYYCENCRTRVKEDDVVCPKCGRYFSAVKCPRCAYSGEAEQFASGCPQCGYLAPNFPLTGSGGRAGSSSMSNRPRRRNRPLPLWVYNSLSILLLIALVVLLIVYSRL